MPGVEKRRRECGGRAGREGSLYEVNKRGIKVGLFTKVCLSRSLIPVNTD